MPRRIATDWTLKKLLQNTYHYYRNRFEYKRRDMVQMVRIERVHVYDNRAPGKARTTYRVISRSYPQYWPYYTRRDARGRRRQRQRTHQHEYQVVLQLDKLSINVPFKARVGADKKWRFGSEHRPRRRRDARSESAAVRESTNVNEGINADWFFRCSHVWQQAGILYGRNWASGPPTQTNPRQIVFAPKHMIAVVEGLMARGILRDT